MDVLKDLAEKFPRRQNLIKYRYSVERVDSEISDVLFTIRNDKEKLRFLGYLHDIYETDYQDHIKECKEPLTCDKNKSYEIALYCIKQVLNEMLDEVGEVSVREKPAMQYFADGQYFDAYYALRECVKSAKKSIILIDGYVSPDTLAFFPTKEPSVKLRILTKKTSFNNAFELAQNLYNKQYSNLKSQFSDKYHDRFLIIDEMEFYHIGTSIKDAGNKKFMFSKIEDSAIQNLILENLKLEWEEVLFD